MWDCPGADDDGNGGDCDSFFDPKTHVLQLADVGATSIFAMDSAMLAKLAAVVGRKEAAVELTMRSEIAALQIGAMWDEENLSYSNLLTNGSYYRRTSPTTFYPLMTTIGATEGAATRVVEAWLTNSSRFCIDTSGGWPHKSGNNEECWWGMPSISFDDRSFYKPTSYIYWRGTPLVSSPQTLPGIHSNHTHTHTHAHAHAHAHNNRQW